MGEANKQAPTTPEGQTTKWGPRRQHTISSQRYRSDCKRNETIRSNNSHRHTVEYKFWWGFGDIAKATTINKLQLATEASGASTKCAHSTESEG